MNWSEYFTYEAGQLYWKVQLSSRGVLGSVAGHLHKQTGYVRVGVGSHQYGVHRIVWELISGNRIPLGYQIDHIDGDRANNDYANLRLVTPQQNKWNLLKCKGWVYVDGKYQARIKVNRKVIVLGYFDNKEDASACYWREKPKYHSMV